jgi:hypothetical protein
MSYMQGHVRSGDDNRVHVWAVVDVAGSYFGVAFCTGWYLPLTTCHRG